MNQSYSDSDISMSPTQILERLQMLRQLQLMQRGKLHQQRLQYHDASESSSCITEMVSHFTNSITSTSYNTFRSLLQSPKDTTNDESPRLESSFKSQNIQENDLIDGVSGLNLSQESEFLKTPSSGRTTANSKSVSKTEHNESIPETSQRLLKKKQISIDEIPILSPKKDFESLVLEKLQGDKEAVKLQSPKKDNVPNTKKTFLRKGEGMNRFGLKRKDLVIQNTGSLPWKKKNRDIIQSPLRKIKQTQRVAVDQKLSEIVVPPLKLKVKQKDEFKILEKQSVTNKASKKNSITSTANDNCNVEYDNSNCSIHSSSKVPDTIIQYPKGKHPILSNKGKTWASVLNKEQNDFLRQLKQSDYYKNFASPAKSTVSDMSCDENSSKLRLEKESAEQNLFEMLENKVSQENFNLENSFFNRFLKRNHLETSGESTPLIFQKCLSVNPKLMHIFPEVNQRKNESCNEDTQSECAECCNDASSVSSCCSCNTVEPATPVTCKNIPKSNKQVNQNKKEVQIQCDQKGKCQNEVDKEHEVMRANMVEMNEKLINTSEILKERLRELEDEIETFRKENANLNKMKETVDMERQQFYEEKKTFEQKFNEEKILSEYYLAEEKEKLNKQKQMYERYVKDMRGRLNKKEKDEVVSLKQEINSLKEEIRIKDAKSTSTIARLRNQIKIIDKEKSQLQEEVEKLKKENRRIQHSNDITRRLTNMKYLEKINSKLSKMNRESQSEVEINSDVKYKAFEIERQSRSRKAQSENNNKIRQRAKSVPNLKVTSRYAKYFSQKDSLSQRDHVAPQTNVERVGVLSDSENELDCNQLDNSYDDEENNQEDSNSHSENNLEKIYMETFRSISPKSNRSSKSNNYLYENNSANSDNGFFFRKSNSSSSRESKSPSDFTIPHLDIHSSRSKSPASVISHKSGNKSPTLVNSENTLRSKTPSSYSSIKLATVIHKDSHENKDSITSNTKMRVETDLNPTEIRKPDGSKELRYPNGNIKQISADGIYSKFLYYNGDIKENFYNEGRIKYFYAESKTVHTTFADGLEVLEFPDGQVEKRYQDGSTEIRLPNGSVRYHDPKNKNLKEEWRFPNGSALTVFANGEKRILFSNKQYEVHSGDHKKRVYPDGTVKLVYKDGTSETRYASGRVRIKDQQGNLIMDSSSTH